MKKNKHMTIILKISAFALLTAAMIISANAQSNDNPQKMESKTSVKNSKAEQEIIELSKQKWQWMSEKKTDLLDKLFQEKAVFVHMGGNMTKEQELGVIKGGMIQYKKADIHEVSVNIIGETAILLNRITLLAVVGGNEVTNPFTVTEVYVKEKGDWKLASLSFTKLLTNENPK